MINRPHCMILASLFFIKNSTYLRQISVKMTRYVCQQSTDYSPYVYVLRVMTQFAVEACASLVKEDDVPGGKVAHQCTLQVFTNFQSDWLIIGL